MNALLDKLHLTDGEKGVLLAAFVVAVFGAGVAHSVVGQLGGGLDIIRTLSNYDIWIIVSGAMGAVMGLYFGRNWFGHPGRAGWRRAFIGIFVTTFVAAICSGTLALPFYGTMFGPFSVVMTFIGSPILAVFWIAILLAAHSLIVDWRYERDSIFRAQPQDLTAI